MFRSKKAKNLAKSKKNCQNAAEILVILNI